MAQNIYKINILKLDHRPERDKRITTHCALVARAFGANFLYYSGIEDFNFENNIKEVCEKWGGDFQIKYELKPLSLIKKLKEDGFIIIHLTMYGELISKKIKDIKNKMKKHKNILLIVGGPKVSKEYYEISEYNVAIGSQPHSEVAAIALFLYMLNTKCLDASFDSKIKIIPNNKYKNVINTLKK